MRTNIDIDDKLMKQAMKESGAKTKRAAVEAGLALLVKSHAQQGIRKLFGKVEWDADHDYKAMRNGDKWNGSSLTWEEEAASPQPAARGSKRGTRKKAA